LCAASVALAACDPGPPPFGFAAAPEQNFIFEAEDRTVVDGVEVQIKRYAEFRLVATALERGGTELACYLKRFYQSVQGPDGANEVAISEEGIVVRGADGQELRLGPEDRTPTANSVAELLDRPAASAIVSSDGVVRGSTFRSYDPLLGDIDPLEWFLLSVPLVAGAENSSWTGSREVPQVGEYRLGVQLPLRYEWTQGEGEGRGLAATGFARRSDLALAEDFRGDLHLEYRGQTQLGDAFELISAALELDVSFVASGGSEIQSAHRVSLRCADCAPVNSK
jgi:hypothetical protein